MAIVTDFEKITIVLGTCFVSDYVRNDNFYKAGNWPKADVPCFFYAHQQYRTVRPPLLGLLSN
jgi:hypothetical protein